MTLHAERLNQFSCSFTSSIANGGFVFVFLIILLLYIFAGFVFFGCKFLKVQWEVGFHKL